MNTIDDSNSKLNTINQKEFSYRLLASNNNLSTLNSNMNTIIEKTNQKIIHSKQQSNSEISKTLLVQKSNNLDVKKTKSNLSNLKSVKPPNNHLKKAIKKNRNMIIRAELNGKEIPLTLYYQNNKGQENINFGESIYSINLSKKRNKKLPKIKTENKEVKTKSLYSAEYNYLKERAAYFRKVFGIEEEDKEKKGKISQKLMKERLMILPAADFFNIKSIILKYERIAKNHREFHIKRRRLKNFHKNSSSIILKVRPKFKIDHKLENQYLENEILNQIEINKKLRGNSPRNITQTNSEKDSKYNLINIDDSNIISPSNKPQSLHDVFETNNTNNSGKKNQSSPNKYSSFNYKNFISKNTVKTNFSERTEDWNLNLHKITENPVSKKGKLKKKDTFLFSGKKSMNYLVNIKPSIKRNDSIDFEKKSVSEKSNKNESETSSKKKIHITNKPKTKSVINNDLNSDITNKDNKRKNDLNQISSRHEKKIEFKTNNKQDSTTTKLVLQRLETKNSYQLEQSQKNEMIHIITKEKFNKINKESVFEFDKKNSSKKQIQLTNILSTEESTKNDTAFNLLTTESNFKINNKRNNKKYNTQIASSNTKIQTVIIINKEKNIGRLFNKNNFKSCKLLDNYKENNLMSLNKHNNKGVLISPCFSTTQKFKSTFSTKNNPQNISKSDSNFYLNNSNSESSLRKSKKLTTINFKENNIKTSDNFYLKGNEDKKVNRETLKDLNFKILKNELDILEAEDGEIEEKYYQKYRVMLNKLEQMKLTMIKNNVLKERDINVIIESRKVSLVEMLKNKYLMSKTIQMHKRDFIKMKRPNDHNKKIEEIFNSTNKAFNKKLNIIDEYKLNQLSNKYDDEFQNSKTKFSFNSKTSIKRNSQYSVSNNRKNTGLDSPTKKKKEKQIKLVNLQNLELHTKLNDAFEKLDN